MRDAYPELPAEPSDEELARDWTITEADRVEVLRCRGDGNRHRFAVQLCALRSLGRFVDDFDAAPVRIVNHVGRQLGFTPSLFIEPPDRRATTAEHAQRIREYLGYQPFDDALVRTWLAERAIEGVPSASLLALAVSTLRGWKMEIPGRSTLERLTGSASARGDEAAWQRVHERLSPEFCDAIDRLLAVADGGRHSGLFQFKQYPPDPRPADIITHLERFDLLRSIGAARVDLAGIPSAVLERLAELGRRYDAKELRRFAPAKRYALVACFLADAQKTTLDHVIEMHREYLTGMRRRSKTNLEKRHRRVRQQSNKCLATVVRAMEIVLDETMPKESRVLNLYMQFDPATLREAMTVVRDLHELGDRGFLDELIARHQHLKRYFPAFLKLPFIAQPGAESLMQAVELARRLHAGEIEQLPPDAPTGFASGPWRAPLATDGRDWRLWEIALAFAVSDALRSGDLYLSESRNHVSFWNLIHDAKQWEQTRAAAYAALNLPTDAAQTLDRLRGELDEAARELAAGIDGNPFAKLIGGRLHYTRREATPEPREVGKIRHVIETNLPLVRVEDVLMEADSWCAFTRELLPLDGYQPRGDENRYAVLLAALVAHGTNLGLHMMAQSTKGISVDMLHHVSKWLLRDETLRAANRVLVDYHHKLPLSSTWGDGTAASSDGQRFGVQARSLLASFYPRYFGYYERAVTVYTHVADQFSVFSSQVISCSEREALYVLDGWLRNDTILRVQEHYTDTHGFTEQLFGLCYLLGFSFMPRFKDLADQKLYKFERGAAYGAIDPIFRGGAIDAALIGEQWDQLVRLASSLRNRSAPAHVIMQRLTGSSDRLAKALTMLGRAVKTTFILKYAHDTPMRDRVNLHLNRGESRHALCRRLFFANQGDFLDGDYAEMMNKATSLALLSNAVLVWNTVRMTEIVSALEATGQPVDRTHLARVSPLAHKHVIPSGTYHFDRITDGRRGLA